MKPTTPNLITQSTTSQPVASQHAVPLGPAAGAACGLTAALGYAGANAALRAATETDAILVSAIKAIPTILACLPLLLLLRWRGRPVATSWRTLPLLLAGVTVGQLFGNLLFQVSLGIIGLALAVPLNLSAMIIAGAILGRLMLGEPVSRRTIVAIIVLIVAASVLSLGGQAITIKGEITWQRMAFGLLTIIISGVAYAFFGVALRRSLREGMSVPLAMCISGTVGALLLGPIAVNQMGLEKIAATSNSQWLMMFIAGGLNMAAFFMLSFSLRAIPVVAVNLLNATQATLAALMGVLMFSEPLTKPLLIGSLLTVAGLVVLGSGGQSLSPRRFFRGKSSSGKQPDNNAQATSPKSNTAP